MSDFYEDDEPTDKIRRAFERGTKRRTRRSRRILRLHWCLLDSLCRSVDAPNRLYVTVLGHTIWLGEDSVYYLKIWLSRRRSGPSSPR